MKNGRVTFSTQASPIDSKIKQLQLSPDRYPLLGEIIALDKKDGGDLHEIVDEWYWNKEGQNWSVAEEAMSNLFKKGERFGIPNNAWMNAENHLSELREYYNGVDKKQVVINFAESEEVLKRRAKQGDSKAEGDLVNYYLRTGEIERLIDNQLNAWKAFNDKKQEKLDLKAAGRYQGSGGRGFSIEAKKNADEIDEARDSWRREGNVLYKIIGVNKYPEIEKLLKRKKDEHTKKYPNVSWSEEPENNSKVGKLLARVNNILEKENLYD